MSKKGIILSISAILLTVLVIGLLIFFSFRKPTFKDISDTILFFGSRCPHCKVVQDFISKNNIHKKIDFLEKEVGSYFGDFKAVVKQCHVPSDRIGVPLLYVAPNRCIVGTDKVIGFFKELA
jgi:hypothetical protein